MNPRQSSRFRLAGATVLLLLSAAVRAADDFEDGPARFGGEWRGDAKSWEALPTELPPYPTRLRNLIELDVSSAKLPYRVYIDPDSFSTGTDNVVRFTSVLVSASGVWNVTYEGMHCGERSYRRLAYGMDGEWRLLEDSPWQPVSGTSVGQFRRLLYQRYLCVAGGGGADAGELVRRLRDSADHNLFE